MITIEEVCCGSKSFDERVALGHKLLLQEQGIWVDKLSNLLVKVEGPHKDIEEFLKELRGDILEAITSYRELTCDTCEDAGKCPFSGDFYYTNGDCLAVK
jgi:hypothetical protein